MLNLSRGYYGKEVTVKVTLRQDRNRDGLRLAKIRNCDEPQVANALLSCMPLVNDNPCKVIVKNSTGYIIRQKTKSFLKRTSYICKAIKKACSKNFPDIADDGYVLNEKAGHLFLQKQMNLPGKRLW